MDKTDKHKTIRMEKHMKIQLLTMKHVLYGYKKCSHLKKNQRWYKSVYL